MKAEPRLTDDFLHPEPETFLISKTRKWREEQDKIEEERRRNEGQGQGLGT